MIQEQLFYNNFSRAASELDNKSFLKDCTKEYPYFGLAQFYLLKTSSLQEKNYSTVAAKTALFFNNPFYLLSQIQPQVEEENGIETTPRVIQYEETINQTDNTLNNKADLHLSNNAHKEVQKEELLFEPLYTTDYFASQGIKLSEVMLGDDKLGKQLKSFTSWLKTMKKVHTDKAIVTTLVETAVQNQAAKSNTEEEVVTESMAEAFVQQDKLVRAIDTYKKLSLLYPAKSAYFTAKIETLK